MGIKSCIKIYIFPHLSENIYFLLPSLHSTIQPFFFFLLQNFIFLLFLFVKSIIFDDLGLENLETFHLNLFLFLSAVAWSITNTLWPWYPFLFKKDNINVLWTFLTYLIVFLNANSIYLFQYLFWLQIEKFIITICLAFKKTIK